MENIRSQLEILVPLDPGELIRHCIVLGWDILRIEEQTSGRTDRLETPKMLEKLWGRCSPIAYAVHYHHVVHQKAKACWRRVGSGRKKGPESQLYCLKFTHIYVRQSAIEKSSSE